MIEASEKKAKESICMSWNRMIDKKFSWRSWKRGGGEVGVETKLHVTLFREQFELHGPLLTAEDALKTTDKTLQKNIYTW